MDAGVLVLAVRGEHQVGRGAPDGRGADDHAGLDGRAPVRRGLRPQGQGGGRGELRQHAVAGVLPAADRAGRAVPGGAPDAGPAPRGAAAGAGRLPGPVAAEPRGHGDPQRLLARRHPARLPPGPPLRPPGRHGSLRLVRPRTPAPPGAPHRPPPGPSPRSEDSS
ncbi:hypothetical protein SGPA1_20614 [Streptomyces misionensis JCM 4497]